MMAYTNFCKKITIIVVELQDHLNPSYRRGIFGDIAQAAGVTRETLSRWMRTPPGDMKPHRRIPSAERVRDVVQGLVEVAKNNSNMGAEDLKKLENEWLSLLLEAAKRDYVAT